jgi:tetratricopeptide (TPR) repeat protein
MVCGGVYLESVDSDASGAVVTVGAPSLERLERVRSSPVPVGELLDWDGGPARRAAVDYYAASWLLVHWLVDVRPEAFVEFSRQFAAGSTPEAAWRTALPDFDPDRPGDLAALDAALGRYARGRLGRQRREGEARPAVGYFERAMPPAEVHAIRLEIWQFGSSRSTAALASEVEEAVQEDPAQPVALEYLAALEHADPLPYARRAVAGHPKDARAYTFLAESLSGPSQADERERALRRAAEIAPRNATALHNLADALLAGGKPLEALPVAREAAKLAPWSPPVLAGYAAVLSGLGQCADAIPVQQRAIDAVPDRAATAERRALARTLAVYSGQCHLSRDGVPP